MLSVEITKLPKWASVAAVRLTQQPIETDETVAGTVSSKERKDPRFRGYGFAGECCEWIWEHPTINETLWYFGGYDPQTQMESPLGEVAHNQEGLLDEGWKLYMKKRCAFHRAAIKRWQHAKKVFVRLDEVRMNEGQEHLRFVTLTRAQWNIVIDVQDDLNQTKEDHKQKCIRQFRNWRNRSEWWKSKNALGQWWPECVVSPVLNQIGALTGVRLHFHLHCVVVSEYLDNRPGEIQFGSNSDGEEISFQEDSEFCREWGGIVDVRAVKDYQVKYQHKGETKRGCGRKACMKYLSKYISKAEGWRSGKIGKW